LYGCGTNRGVPEFHLYVQAFNTQYEQADAIFNAVGQAERTVVLRNIRKSAIPDFDPDQAAYFVENVDPPITALMRASLKTLKSYNDAVDALVNGAAAEALANRIGDLTANVTGAIAAAELAVSGAGAIPGAEQLVANSTKSLNLSTPVIKELATLASRAAFRQQLIATYPYMKDLLVTLRNGTPAMFEMLKRAQVTRGSLDNPLGISPAGVAIVEKDRALLAGWVLLLDKTLATMQAAVTAAMAEPTAVALADLAEQSVELRVLAEQIRSIRSKP